MPWMTCEYRVQSMADRNEPVTAAWQSQVCGQTIPVDITDAECSDGEKCVLMYKATHDGKTAECSWAFGIDTAAPQLTITNTRVTRGDLTRTNLILTSSNEADESGILGAGLTDTTNQPLFAQTPVTYACTGVETNTGPFSLDSDYNALGQFFCGFIPAGVGSQHTLVAGAVDNALNSATATTAFELCKIDSASITPVCDAAGCRLDFDVGVRWKGGNNPNDLCPVTSISDPRGTLFPPLHPKITIYGSDVPGG